jgi:hypothetical protein
MSLMQCKDHSLLLEGKTLGCPTDGFLATDDDDFTKNVNFLRNEGLLGPR